MYLHLCVCVCVCVVQDVCGKYERLRRASLLLSGARYQAFRGRTQQVCLKSPVLCMPRVYINLASPRLQKQALINKTGMTNLSGANVILASASPERRSILTALAGQCRFASLSFAVSGFEEDISHAGLKPLAYAQLTARKKAEFTLAAYRQTDTTIISADTIVILSVSTHF